MGTTVGRPLEAHPHSSDWYWLAARPWARGCKFNHDEGKAPTQELSPGKTMLGKGETGVNGSGCWSGLVRHSIQQPRIGFLLGFFPSIHSITMRCQVGKYGTIHSTKNCFFFFFTNFAIVNSPDIYTCTHSPGTLANIG